MTFKVRAVRPQQTEWREIEAVDPVDAIQRLHCEGAHPKIHYRHEFEPGLFETVVFAVYEVEGFEGERVARLFSRFIARKGGVRPPGADRTLADIAAKLGWGRHPERLLAPGWDGEEENWT
jgi:hypothetical protein